MMAVHDEDGIRLWFEAMTGGKAIKTVPDTAEYPTNPNAEVAVSLKNLDPSKLVGKQFLVLSGYDEEIEDHVATIYYYEHEDLNDNVIEITAQDSNRFHVRWTGTTGDVNFYDDSKPKTRVEIEGEFTFKDMKKWVKKKTGRK
jgi:hypothetical protein